MRIDPKGTIAGHPAMQVRQVLRRLSFCLQWDASQLESAAGIAAAEGRSFARALVAAGLAEAVGKGMWSLTQAGKTLSSATAAPPVTRATAERALREFLERVEHVNRSETYLGKVIAVVLFGSMLKPEVDRLSDVDLAVEIAPKESDRAKARAINERRVEELESQGHGFRNFLERQFFWHYEVIHELKGGSRVISLADLRAEGEFILAVPHRILFAEATWKPSPSPKVEVRRRREKPPTDCPF